MKARRPATLPPERIEFLGQKNFPPGTNDKPASGFGGGGGMWGGSGFGSAAMELARFDPSHDVAAILSFKDVNGSKSPRSDLDGEVRFGSSEPFFCPVEHLKDRLQVRIPRGYADPPRFATCSLYRESIFPRIATSGGPQSWPVQPSKTLVGTWTLKELPQAPDYLKHPRRDPILKARHAESNGSPAITFDYSSPLPAGWRWSIDPLRLSHIFNPLTQGGMVSEKTYISRFAAAQDAVECSVILARSVEVSGYIKLAGCQLVAHLGTPYFVIPDNVSITIGSEKVVFPAQRLRMSYMEKGKVRGVNLGYEFGRTSRLNIDFFECDGPDLAPYGIGQVDALGRRGRRYPDSSPPQPFKFGNLPPLVFRYSGKEFQRRVVYHGVIPIEGGP